MSADRAEGHKYSVSYEEFVGPYPEVLEKFNWQSSLIRANFTDWLITGFRISGSVGQAHRAFCLWGDEHLRYDCQTTLINFQRAAKKDETFDFLSTDERHRLVEAFRMQAAHGGKLLERQDLGMSMTDWDILREIRSQVSEETGMIGENYDQYLPEYLDRDQLKGMSKEEFLRRVGHYIQHG